MRRVLSKTTEERKEKKKKSPNVCSLHNRLLLFVCSLQPPHSSGKKKKKKKKQAATFAVTERILCVVTQNVPSFSFCEFLIAKNYWLEAYLIFFSHGKLTVYVRTTKQYFVETFLHQYYR
eukprot:TRINITY_DN2009_c2_g2_i1.p1 TRINITY_DN2009_c2_g2~~TRINITY_DN2009_c2_g2_i1.p1  ORF type:complete len:120 (+),score=6.46 TRINITY_DN2009_c2_g2_i1:367-726(+)